MLFCPVAPGAPGSPLPGSGALALSLCSRPWEGSGSCCRKFSQPQQPDRSPDPTWLTTVAGAAWASSLLSCSVVGSGAWPTRALTYRPGAHHSQQSRRPSSPAWGSLSSAMWWLWLVVPLVPSSPRIQPRWCRVSRLACRACGIRVLVHCPFHSSVCVSSSKHWCDPTEFMVWCGPQLPRGLKVLGGRTRAPAKLQDTPLPSLGPRSGPGGRAGRWPEPAGPSCPS